MVGDVKVAALAILENGVDFRFAVVVVERSCERSCWSGLLLLLLLRLPHAADVVNCRRYV